MQNRIACTILRRLEELEVLEPAWRRLWESDPQATPFQSPEWLLPWARQFARSDLRSVLVHDRGVLVALLPFYLFVDTHTIESRCLPLGAGTSDYLDGIHSPFCSTEHICEGLRFLCRENDWDTLNILQVRNSSPLRQAFLRLPLPGLRRLPSESCSQFPAAVIDQLPRSVRKQAQYYRKRAMGAGRLEFTVAGESDWHAVFDALERMHSFRWQAVGQPGLLSNPRVPAWHREALPALLRRGLLRLFALSLDGEIIAALYSLIDPPSRSQRTLYFYMNAFSVAHAEFRPGTVLMAVAVEHAAREGVKTIDLLRGDEPYKRLWHADRVTTYGFSMPRMPLSSCAFGSAAAKKEAA